MNDIAEALDRLTKTLQTIYIVELENKDLSLQAIDTIERFRHINGD